MKFPQGVGITSYGVALPQFMIEASEIERAQGKPGSGIPQSLGVKQKSVPAIDEDTITLATQAGEQALQRQPQARDQIGAVFVGSESHPYAVKPSGTVVKSALQLPEHTALADLQFACKAGTQAVQIVAAYVAAGLIPAGLAIGADTAQSRPGDVLEFTAGAGAAAFVMGKDAVLVELLASVSVASDTPDFWRRPGQSYPEHAGRFSGEPAYFAHVMSATKALLTEVELQPSDIDFCIFHTPNAKFPQAVATKLGFKPEQLAPSLIVKQIGNTYAGASLLALAAVLDQAKANQTILVTSYGSGAGADSFLWRTTAELPKRRAKWQRLVAAQIVQLKSVSYQEYANFTGASHS
jgi:hydroxymethylglutaryl-CoA synthase